MAWWKPKDVIDHLKPAVRTVLGWHAEVGKVAIPVVSAGVTYWAGPIAGEAVAYGATRVQQVAEQAALRNEGVYGQDNADQARAMANRTFLYSQIGVGAGTLASLGTGIATGSSLGQTTSQTLFGQGGSSALGTGGGLYGAPNIAFEGPVEAAAAGVGGSSVLTGLGAVTAASKVPGLITSYDQPAEKPSGGGDLWGGLGKLVAGGLGASGDAGGAGGELARQVLTPGGPGEAHPGIENAPGGNLPSWAWILLGVGAVVLLNK